MAACELAQRAVRVMGVVASLSACWGVLRPRPVLPSLPAGEDLRKVGQEGLVTGLCAHRAEPTSGGLAPFRVAVAPHSILAQPARPHFQPSSSISKAIFTYLRQKELRVGGQIISLLFLQ